MTKDNEQYAYFTVVGDFDPNAITSRLGLEPSESWIRGSRNERTHHERKLSRWSLDSRLDRSTSLENHVRDVLQQTLLRTQEIRRLGEEYEAWIQVVGWFHNSYPGFSMDKETISYLARLSIGIDCDFYYLYSDSREDS
jgi:hypothetical protein